MTTTGDMKIALKKTCSRSTRTQVRKYADQYACTMCKRVRDATLLSIFQFFTFAARI